MGRGTGIVRLIAGTMALWGIIALSVCGARVVGVTRPTEDRIVSLLLAPALPAWKDKTGPARNWRSIHAMRWTIQFFMYCTSSE